MKKISLALLVLFIVAFSAPAQTRITFKRGTKSVVVSGNLYNYKSKKTYVIRVRAGQTMRIEQVGGANRRTTLAITDPAGGDASDADLSCNNQKIIESTMRGDYRITVTECMKADPWRGAYKLKFTVE